VLIHLGVAKNAGGELADEVNASVDDKMRSLLVLARKLTLEPANVSTGDIEEVARHGWSEQAIEDAIAVVSTFSLINRLVDGLGLGASKDHFEMLGNLVAQEGYEPLVKMLSEKAGTQSEGKRDVECGIG
jgi:hypothetical protein